MCGLCSNNRDVRTEARADMLKLVAQLEALAGQYRGMLNGELDPHSKDVGGIESGARAVIKALVEEWL